MTDRLTEKNIVAVHERRTPEGITYGYYVICRGGISNNRNYAVYDENRRTAAEEFKLEWLPKTVQKFIAKHQPGELDDLADGYTRITYK